MFDKVDDNLDDSKSVGVAMFLFNLFSLSERKLMFGALESASEAFKEVVNSARESCWVIVDFDCQVMLMGGEVSVNITSAFEEVVGTSNEAVGCS